MANKRDVELALRATDLATKTFNDVSAATDQLTASLAKQTEAAKTGNISVSALKSTLDKLVATQADLTRDNVLVERYKAAAAAMARTEAAAAAAAAKLNTLKAAQESSGRSSAKQASDLLKAEAAVTRTAGKFAAAREDAASYAAQLERVGLSSTNLAAADAKILAGFTALRSAINLNKTAIAEYDASLFEANQREQATAKAAAEREAKNAADYVKFWTTALNEREVAERAAAASRTAAAQAAAQREAETATQTAERTARTAAEAAARAKAAADNAAYEEQQRAVARMGEIKKAQEAKDAKAAMEFRQAQQAAQAKFYVADWERMLAERDAISEAQVQKEKKRQAELDAVIESYLKKEERARSGAQQSSGSASQQRVFLGLKPYELQDIAYRVNDVFVQLAAGQTLTESLAVQGFKAFKIFDGEIGNLLGMLPALAAGAAVLGALALALVRVEENTSAVRAYSRELAVSADGAKYNAAALVEQQRALEHVGIGFKDAGKAFAEFMKVGASESDLPKLTQQAFDLSRVFGGTVPEAAKKLADGFHGGIREIIDLNNQYNFLTTTQYKTIQAMFDAGKATQAQAMAQDILAQKTHAAAEAFEGPWTHAFRDAKIAAEGFFDILANGEIGRELSSLANRVANDLDRWVKDIKWLTDHVPNMGGGGDGDGSQADLQAQLDAARQRRDDLKAQREKADHAPAWGLGSAKGDLDKEVAAADAEYLRLSEAIDKARQAQDKHTTSVKQTGAAVADTSARDIAGMKMVHDLELQYAREKRTDRPGQIKAAGEEAYQNVLEGSKSPSAADQARKDAEAHERYTLAEQDRQKSVRLIDELEAAGKQALKGTQDSLDAQLRAVDDTYAKILIKLQQFQHQGGGSIMGMSPDAFRAALEQSKELIKQQTTMEYYDKEISTLQKDRSEQEKSIMEQLHNGTLTAAEAFSKLTEIVAKTKPQIHDLSDAAIAYAKAMQSVRPGPTLDAFKGRMQSAQAGNTGADGSGIDKEELKQANDLLKQRNDLAKQFQDLANAGAMSQRDANKQITAVYADMKTQILNALDALEKFMKVAGNTGPAYQMSLLRAEIAKLKGEAQEATPQAQKLTEQIEKVATSSIVNGFEKMADIIGQWGEKGKKAKDIFQELGATAVQMVANIIKGVAEQILQEQVLITVKEIEAAIAHDGAVVGDSSGGVMSRAVNPGVFAGAPRYHSGGVVGLGSDEQAAILQKGEEVLKRSDPRNVLNGGRSGGSGGGGGQSIRQVLAFNERDIAGAMSGSHGEKVMLTHLKSNLPTVRTWLNGKG